MVVGDRLREFVCNNGSGVPMRRTFRFVVVVVVSKISASVDQDGVVVLAGAVGSLAKIRSIL